MEAVKMNDKTSHCCTRVLAIGINKKIKVCLNRLYYNQSNCHTASATLLFSDFFDFHRGLFTKKKDL